MQITLWKVHDLYVYIVYNRLIGVDIADNNVGKVFSTIMLCYNFFVILFQLSFNASFFEIVNHLYK